MENIDYELRNLKENEIEIWLDFLVECFKEK
jgi:hypothetical protein